MNFERIFMIIAKYLYLVFIFFYLIILTIVPVAFSGKYKTESDIVFCMQMFALISTVVLLVSELFFIKKRAVFYLAGTLCFTIQVIARIYWIIQTSEKQLNAGDIFIVTNLIVFTFVLVKFYANERKNGPT